jgi:hypothetical protein
VIKFAAAPVAAADVAQAKLEGALAQIDDNIARVNKRIAAIRCPPIPIYPWPA